MGAAVYLIVIGSARAIVLQQCARSVRDSALGIVYGSAHGSVYECARLCAAVRAAAHVCGSVWQCCVAVLCGSAHSSVHAVCAVRVAHSTRAAVHLVDLW
jgi:hypothetical protein